MADSVGRDNMRILGNKQCDSWHEKIWGKRYYCCTNDCQYQKCGKKCSSLGKKDAEGDYMERLACTFNIEGEDYESFQYFCCNK